MSSWLARLLWRRNRTGPTRSDPWPSFAGLSGVLGVEQGDLWRPAYTTQTGPPLRKSEAGEAAGPLGAGTGAGRITEPLFVEDPLAIRQDCHDVGSENSSRNFYAH